MSAKIQGICGSESSWTNRKPLRQVSPAFIRKTQAKLKLSRGVFARKLYTYVRTLENWEQGRGKPNAQATVLLRLVNRYPDTLARLDRVAGE